MKKDKSPGIDRLTTEFYMKYQEMLNQDLRECKAKGKLTNTMNTALLRLIYKISGSRHELNNWRQQSFDGGL